MREVASWPNTAVVSPSVQVLRNGEPADVDSVSVDREIPANTPGQISAVGGVVAATGSVEWSQADDATERVATPWTTRDRPTLGDEVEILAGRDGANTRVFTGMVDDAGGQFSDSAFSSGIVDHVDRLNRTVSWDALGLVMPPWDPNNPTDYKRMTGLTGVYVTDKCLREGGFNATPPRDLNCVVSAPLMGSTWPEHGSLMDSCRVQDIGNGYRLSPRWTSSRWGVSTTDAYASYLPWLGDLDGKITTDTPLNITLMSGVSANMSASGYVMAYMTDGTILRLGVTSSRSLVGQVVQNGTTNTVVTVTQGQIGGEWSTATLRIYPDGAGGWTWEIKTDLTPVHGNTTTATSAVFTTAALNRVTVYAPVGTFMGGAQVSFAPLTRGSACMYQRTARVSVAKIWYLDAIPALASTPAIDVLKQQAEAEWAGLWIDENGVAQWRDVDRMVEATSVATLTAADDLLDVKFRFDSQDVRRRTVVAYKSMAGSTTRQQRLIGYEASKDELEAGDSIDVWIEPESGTYWLDADDTPLEVYGVFGGTSVSKGLGTLIGFTGIDVNGNEVAVVDSTGNPLGNWEISLEKVGTKFHFVCNIISLPSGVDRVRMATKTTGTGAYLDMGLPLIRARGIIAEASQEYVSPIVGPEWSADYTHEGSWFVQHADQAKDIGDKIAHQISTPTPVVESVDIIADPRLQLGDKVMVRDEVRTGVTITGVITGISQSVSAGDHTMSLKLLVTQVATPNVTIDDFDAWYSGMTLDELDASLAGEDLDGLDSAPLR